MREVASLGHVLPQRHQSLHRAVMERLGQAGPLAPLGVQHLGQQPRAIGRQPCNVRRSLV
jgi:hypothetical protein